MYKSLRLYAIILLIFNGVSALAGGWAMISKPDGSALAMPLDMLRYSPFTNFLIPGIILFVLNGISSILVSILSILRVKNYHLPVIFQGCVLTGWIIVQLAMIRSIHVLHLSYGLIGIVLIILGLSIKKNLANSGE